LRSGLKSYNNTDPPPTTTMVRWWLVWLVVLREV